MQSKAIFRGFVGGRGVGKSRIGAYDLLKRAEPGKLYMVVEPSVSAIKDTAIPAFKTVAAQIGRWQWIRESDHRGKFRTKCGGMAHISFRGADDPETLRGPNVAGVWMDEASLCKEEAYKILIACLRDNGKMGWLAATFTPKGKRHWTYRVFGENRDSNHHLVRCRTQDNPFLPPEYSDIIANEYTAEKRRQELDGEFIDAEGQLISYDAMLVVSSVCLWENGTVSRGPRPELYLGVDIGRTRDLTVIWTWEKVGDVLWCRDIWEGRGVTFAAQEAEITKRLTQYGRVVKCLIDKGGIGYQLAENLETAFPGKVEGVHLTGGNMAAIANGLAVAVESNKVRIPSSRTVHDDWAMVPKPDTKSGKDTLAKIERDKELGHADRFWAAALGVDAANQTPPTPTFGRPKGFSSGRR